MADEISQVPQTGVNPLWPITGAAIGGVGTAYAVNRVTKPKYGSYEEIINKMAPDTFESTVKDAAEGDKALLEKVRQIRNARAEVTKTVNDEINALKTPGASTELPENHQALADLKAANEKLEAKKNAIIESKLANITPEQQAHLEDLKKRQASIYKPRKAAVDKINAELPKFAEELKALEARRQAINAEFANFVEQQKLNSAEAKLAFEKAKGKNANKGVILNSSKQIKNFSKPVQEKFEQLAASLKALEKEEVAIQERIANLANNEVLGFGKDAEAKKQFVKEMQEAVGNTVAREEAKIPVEVSKELAERQANVEKVTTSVAEKYNSAVESYMTKKAGILTEIQFAAENNDKKAMEAAIAKLTKDEQKIVNKYIDKNGKISASNVEKAANEITSRIDNKFTAMVVKNQEKQSLEEAKKLDAIYEKIQTAFNKKDQKAVNEAFNELRAANPEYAAKLEELYVKNQSAEGLKAAITEVKADQAKKLADFKKAVADIDALKAEVEQIGGKGARLATVDGAVRVVDAEGNVVTSVTRKLTKEQSRNLRTRVSVPEFGKLKALNERIAELSNSGASREEIAAALQESEYAEELKAVKEAETRVAEAKAKLPKAEALTDQQALEKWLKDKGVTSKEEYINKQVEEKSKGLMDEVKTLFERKHGFEGNFKTKATIAALTGAVVLGGIFKALAPKHEG